MNRQKIDFDQARSLLVLSAALVMIVTLAVGATGWTRGINILAFVGFGTILISSMLVRSILPALVAHLFSLIIGVSWSFWVTSRLLPATYSWQERWDNLAMRLYNWYLVALQGGTSYDNLMFLLQMGVILWITGYLTIWFVFVSKKPWLAILPGGLVLLVNLYYAPNDISFWFVVYMIVSLLLIVRFNLFAQEMQWRSEGVFFRPDISFDFLRDGLIFSVLVVAVAWFTPPLVDVKTVGLLDEFQGSWRDAQDDWNRLFADLNYRDRAAYDTFGASLTLGGARNLSDEPVMDVQVEGLGRYWRAAVYDYYTGDGWLTRNEDRAEFGPAESGVALPVFEMRQPVTQTYTYYRDNATVLYAMANVISLDRSARVTFNALTADELDHAPGWLGSSEPWAEEITYIRSNTTVDQQESYRAVSLASQATVEQLTNAGSDYPDWIERRYLNLPASVTDRTRTLAQELTAGYDNSFQKAQAIERYLRNEITYNEKITEPPPGVDKVDYILFRSQEAYCDYYASAMIVMLRSLGIPARLAAGFARGTFDSEKDAFEVLSKDAHSWVEVYFPRYGWIAFEPTAAQPTIIRPTDTERGNSFAAGSMIPDELSDGPEEADQPENILVDDENILADSGFALPFFGGSFNISQTVVGGGAVTLGVIILLLLLGGGLWWRRQNSPQAHQPLPALYRRMVRLAGWMGVTLQPWQTPYEHSTTLQRSLPARQQEIELITRRYVHKIYSRSAADLTAPTDEDSNNAWNRLRPEMLKQALVRRLPGWLRR